MYLSYQCHIHMEDGRNYVKLHKFHIQANKELLGAKHIKFHKIKLLTRYVKLWKSEEEPEIYWTNFISRKYVSNHIVILLSNIYLTHSRIYLIQFLSRIFILPPHPITQSDSIIFVLLQTKLRIFCHNSGSILIILWTLYLLYCGD